MGTLYKHKAEVVNDGAQRIKAFSRQESLHSSPGCFLRFNAVATEIQRIAAELLREFPRLVDTLRRRSKADPFVIATAIERGAIVVTGEPLTGKMNKPRIPDACQAKGIRCINFLQLIRELKLSF